MSLSMAIFTFINAWWIMLFFVLPFGIQRPNQHSATEYAAAPKPVSWKKKFMITSLLAFVVTIVLAVVINSGLINVHDLV